MIFDWQRLGRLFITSPPLQSLIIGLLATLLAKAVWVAAPATFTALDWAIYDTWLRHRAPIAASPSLTIVARDPADEERFGTGLWDRAILAQLITAAHEAGASAIGVDHRLGHASPASLGGAANDALLLEALSTAAPVVLVYDADASLQSDAVIQGHVTVAVDQDHVIRHIPMLATIDGRSVPAFASLMYDLSAAQVSSARPVISERAAPILINPVGNGSLSTLPWVPLSSVWNAIQQHDTRQLDEWFKNRVVVIPLTPTAEGPWLLPTGQEIGGMAAHLQLLNSLLTGNQVCPTGPSSRFGLTVLLASLVGGCLLHARGSVGIWFAAGAMVIYGVLVAALLPALHLALPLASPLSASLLVVVGATAWSHFTATQRLALLERDMLRVQQDAGAVREALILRETRAEALQEDLEAANAAIMHSADKQQALASAAESLRSQLADAQAQEETARRQLERLERQLHDLRAAGTVADSLGNAELDQLRTECRRLGIMTQDAGLLRMFRDLKKGATSPLTVLLLGEPGTGKELFARAVHRLSPRSGKTFVAVNMAAIPPELFESELFGHTKGSFTGATDRRGYFELADHGTIFLDEIGDLRLDHQSKLLRVLQEKSFYRVGATISTTVDVRIVAATNRDLQRGVSEGWFREDLYFRLNGVVFRLPPLRERPGDIAVIAETSLAEIAQAMGRAVPQLSNDTLHLLEEYDWPGNVRELRHALERAVALSDGMLLTRQAFALEGTRLDEVERDATDATRLPDSAGDQAVLHCLRQQHFDMQATAKMLGWDRSTVTQRLKGLCFQALVDAQGNQAKAAMVIAGDPSHLRIVELKLNDYYGHLQSIIAPFKSADDALPECRRRFKNLPERHFSSVEALVKHHFAAQLDR